MSEKPKVCWCGKGMRPAAIRLINVERSALGLLPLAPHERDEVAMSALLDELCELRIKNGRSVPCATLEAVPG